MPVSMEALDCLPVPNSCLSVFYVWDMVLGLPFAPEYHCIPASLIASEEDLVRFGGDCVGIISTKGCGVVEMLLCRITFSLYAPLPPPPHIVTHRCTFSFLSCAALLGTVHCCEEFICFFCRDAGKVCSKNGLDIDLHIPEVIALLHYLHNCYCHV